MARMTRLGSRLTALGSWRPSLALFRGCICRGWPTGVGGVPVDPGFEGVNALQEAEELVLHARRGLLPILCWYAKPLRKGYGIKPIAHDAISSCLVSSSIS
jgi:hypothetical protein